MNSKERYLSVVMKGLTTILDESTVNCEQCFIEVKCSILITIQYATWNGQLINIEQTDFCTDFALKFDFCFQFKKIFSSSLVLTN